MTKMMKLIFSFMVLMVALNFQGAHPTVAGDQSFHVYKNGVDASNVVIDELTEDIDDFEESIKVPRIALVKTKKKNHIRATQLCLFAKRLILVSSDLPPPVKA